MARRFSVGVNHPEGNSRSGGLGIESISTQYPVWFHWPISSLTTVPTAPTNLASSNPLVFTCSTRWPMRKLMGAPAHSSRAAVSGRPCLNSLHAVPCVSENWLTLWIVLERSHGLLHKREQPGQQVFGALALRFWRLQILLHQVINRAVVLGLIQHRFNPGPVRASVFVAID